MATTRFRSLTAGAVAALGALALTGCGSAGSGSSADLDNGKTQFTQKCGACHTLASAGSKGTIGPNLDDAFRGPRSEGFPASHFEGVVKYWIEHAEQLRQPVMPRDLVTGDDARDVAAFVAVTAGLTPGSTSVEPSPATAARPVPGDGPDLSDKAPGN